LFQAIELKLFELFNRTALYLKSERGQTTSEYVAVTAVAVAIALTVIFATLSTALSDAIEDIAASITDFVGAELPGGGS
jgi:Flp pilus assembly pilin Flp